jgi:hypothetical protein
MEELSRHLAEIIVTPIPVPADCVDGFGGAFWKRPSAYLDPAENRMRPHVLFRLAPDALGT